jgi:cellulose biosynthesis protein BcsQ
MKGVAIVSTKGGVGKTTLSHLLALGGAWKNVPSYLMHTDDRAPIAVNGRPYAYYDARDPQTLSTLMSAIVNDDGLCIIDSGGNRPDFDRWIADSADLVLIPVTPDPEAVDLALEHMTRLSNYRSHNIRFVLNTVSSNKHEKLRDSAEYFNLLPSELIIGEIGRVAAVKRLRETDKTPFVTPPTNVNNLSRKFYNIVSDALQSISND